MQAAAANTGALRALALLRDAGVPFHVAVLMACPAPAWRLVVFKCHSVAPSQRKPADTMGLGAPAVALVSTLASVTPAPPFVFRSYQPPPGSEALADQMGAHGGSCKHPVWQAVRASSAASFYLEDFRWVRTAGRAAGA